MYQSQPTSPFIRQINQSEQNYLTKKLLSFFQSDKENLAQQNPSLKMTKMSIGQNEMDIFLIQILQMIKLKRENTKEIIKGLVKEKQNKRIVVGISGQKPFPVHKGKQLQSSATQSLLKTPKKSLFNLSILLKLKSQQSPYISMFACNCLMSILLLYLNKNKSDFKNDDLKIKWKYDFYVKEQKVGQIMILNQSKGDDVFTNIGIRIKLEQITPNHESFALDLLQQFASRINISKNLRQMATKIQQSYESSLMDLGQEVFIKRRQPNQWQETVSGKFVRVNEVGHAILQNEDGQEQEVEQGHMQRRGNVEPFKEEDKQKQENENIEVIQM